MKPQELRARTMHYKLIFPQILMCKSPPLVSEEMKVLQINLPAIVLSLPLMKPPQICCFNHVRENSFFVLFSYRNS